MLRASHDSSTKRLGAHARIKDNNKSTHDAYAHATHGAHHHLRLVHGQRVNRYQWKLVHDGLTGNISIILPDCAINHINIRQ